MTSENPVRCDEHDMCEEDMVIWLWWMAEHTLDIRACMRTARALGQLTIKHIYITVQGLLKCMNKLP